MKQKSLFKIIFWVLAVFSSWFVLKQCGSGRISEAFAEADAGLQSIIRPQWEILNNCYYELDIEVNVYPNKFSLSYLNGFQNLQVEHRFYQLFLDSLREQMIISAGSVNKHFNPQSLEGERGVVKQFLLTGDTSNLIKLSERTQRLHSAMLALVNNDKNFINELSHEFNATNDGRFTMNGYSSNFRELPFSGALAILSLLKASALKDMIWVSNYCNMKTSGSWSWRHSESRPSISSKSDFAPSGVRYQADIFLSGFAPARNVKAFFNGKLYTPKNADSYYLKFEEEPKTLGEHHFMVEVSGNIIQEKENKFYLDTFQAAKQFSYWVISAHPQLQQPKRTQLLYEYIENPVTVNVWDDYAIGEVKALKGDASIKNLGDGKYLITPHSLKTVTLKVGKFATFQYKVHPLPDPRLILAEGISGAFIKQDVLAAQSELRATFPADFDFPVDCKILDFHVTRFRKREDPEEVDNQGSAFNSSVRNLLEKALPGDRLVFDEVRVLYGKEPTPRVLNGFSVRVE